MNICQMNECVNDPVCLLGAISYLVYVLIRFIVGRPEMFWKEETSVGVLLRQDEWCVDTRARERVTGLVGAKGFGGASSGGMYRTGRH